MYLIATWAAWRYSGNVTGPDSRFSSPSVTGEPVAFLGEPSTAALGCDEPLPELDDVVEPELLLLPQPATSAPAAATEATVPVHLHCNLMGVDSSRSMSGGRHGGVAEVA